MSDRSDAFVEIQRESEEWRRALEAAGARTRATCGCDPLRRIRVRMYMGAWICGRCNRFVGP